VKGAATILVVDDEAEIREALTQILTDIRMPDLDGRALYREIEQRWPERAARVVFVTGDTLTSALRDFAAASGRPVIVEPNARFLRLSATAETLKAWQCIGCGRVEADGRCLGICEDALTAPSSGRRARSSDSKALERPSSPRR